MALTIETGSIVAGADSFVTVAELRAFATKRGATVPAGDPACEVLLVKAIDYLQAQERLFQGRRVRGDQPLCWPRYGVCVDDFWIAADAIPADIKSAQMALAIEAQTLDLLPTLDAASQVGPVTEESVDVLTVKYGAPAVNRTVSSFAKADGYLAKYFSGGKGQVRLIRA